MEQNKTTKTTTKQVRWKCPTCDSGVLASSKPRMNDIKRYCFPCSTKAGVLVMRVAPALEKKREANKEKNVAKAKVKKAKVATAKKAMSQEAKNIKKRNDIFQKEAEKLWELFSPYTNRPLPKIKIVYTRQNWGESGLWDGYNTATIRIIRNHEGGVGAWEVLAHELCHAAYRSTHGRGNEGGHGETFYKMLRDVTERRWKVRIQGWHEINGATSSSKSWGYKVDWIIRRSLTEQGVVGLKFPATGKVK